MSERLNDLMDSDHAMLLPLPDFAQNLVCAVNVEGEWNRCRIISFDKEIAKVYLMNVGKTISVKVDTLFCMRKINFPIPPTRLCRLRRVRSAGHPPNWSRGSVDITKQLIEKADAIHIQYY